VESEPSCCLKCHFGWEEKHAFHQLPADLADELRREHRILAKLGYPKEAVLNHAEREMLCFRWYCDPDIVAFAQRDHALFDEGVMPLV